MYGAVSRPPWIRCRPRSARRVVPQVPDRLGHELTAQADNGLTVKRVKLITAGVILASFLSALEATVVSTAMPTANQVGISAQCSLRPGEAVGRVLDFGRAYGG